MTATLRLDPSVVTEFHVPFLRQSTRTWFGASEHGIGQNWWKTGERDAIGYWCGSGCGNEAEKGGCPWTGPGNVPLTPQPNPKCKIRKGLIPGDWVKVTKPTNDDGPFRWVDSMDRYDGKVMRVSRINSDQSINLEGAVSAWDHAWNFQASWLTKTTERRRRAT